jgi:hypothetical protein
MIWINSYAFQVLHIFENIRKESESDRIKLSLCRFDYYSLVDALESLEEQINNTMLRLVLEVSLILLLFRCHSIWMSSRKDISHTDVRVLQSVP